MLYDKIFEAANPIRTDEQDQELWCGVNGIDNHSSIQDTISKQTNDMVSWYQTNKIEVEDGPEIHCETGVTEGGLGIQFGQIGIESATILTQHVESYISFSVDAYPYDDYEYKEYLRKKGELESELWSVQNEIQEKDELAQENRKQMEICKDTALSLDPMNTYDFLVCLEYPDIELDDLGAFVGEWWDWTFDDESPEWVLRGYIYKHSTTKLDNYMNPDEQEEEMVKQLQVDLDDNWVELGKAYQKLQDISDRIQEEESDLEAEYEKLAKETDPEQRRIIEENIRRIEKQLDDDRAERGRIQDDYDEKKTNYPKPYDDFKERTGEQYDHKQEPQRTFFKPVGTLKLKKNIVSPYDFDEETWYIYKNMLNGEGEVVDPENWDYNAQAFVDEFIEFKESYQKQVEMWNELHRERKSALDRLEELNEDLERIKKELDELKDPKRPVEIPDLLCTFIQGGSFTIKRMLAMGDTATIKGRAGYEVLSGNGWEHPNEYEVNIDNPPFDNNKFVKYVLDDTLYRTITLNESVKDKVFST